jgi:hypothetical protein
MIIDARGRKMGRILSHGIQGMADPKLINSPLSRVVEEDGVSVDVKIYRLEDTEWSLEIVAENGNSTVWNDLFSSDSAAFAEALNTIKEEGIKSFSETDPDPGTTLH